jgi:hypothetical protein
MTGTTLNGVTSGDAIQIWDSRDLLGVFYDQRLASRSTYFRDLCFTGAAHLSSQRYIDFEKVRSRRPIAPFVLPAETGKGIYKRNESQVRQFTPAYVKPKDPVIPGDSFRRRAGDVLNPVPLTPQQVFDQDVIDVVQYQQQAIDRTWEWMAAQAVLNGKVPVTYENGTSVVLDFGRNDANTVDYSGLTDTTKMWSDPNYDIISDIQKWCDLMALQDFGAMPNRLTVGYKAWQSMRVNLSLIAEMSLLRRGNTELTIPTGIRPSLNIGNNNSRQLGVLSNGLELWLFDDFYQNNEGQFVRFMDPRDVVLTGPNVDGVPCFGAIIDADAGLQPTDVFMKMWKENDPSALFIMSQSAPLYVPVNPDQTFRARVQA